MRGEFVITNIQEGKPTDRGNWYRVHYELHASSGASRGWFFNLIAQDELDAWLVAQHKLSQYYKQKELK